MPKGKLKKASEDTRAAAIRKAVGAGPDDEVIVTTPTFRRPKNWKPPAVLTSGGNMKAFFGSLPLLADEHLQELGLRKWGREHEHADGTESGPMLWLFPGEWYDRILDGTPIVDINFNRETFKSGETDDDIRFGCLAFGIPKEERQC